MLNAAFLSAFDAADPSISFLEKKPTNDPHSYFSAFYGYEMCLLINVLWVGLNWLANGSFFEQKEPSLS